MCFGVTRTTHLSDQDRLLGLGNDNTSFLVFRTKISILRIRAYHDLSTYLFPTDQLLAISLQTHEFGSREMDAMCCSNWREVRHTCKSLVAIFILALTLSFAGLSESDLDEEILFRLGELYKRQYDQRRQA
jgi:hypothetical protein